MIERKVWEGVGMSAALRDADESRYLDPQEEAALQRFKMEFGGYCRGLAAELIAVHPSETEAKQALRNGLSNIERAASGFDASERDLIDYFLGHVDQAIQAVASQSPFRQRLGLVWFRTPNIIKALVIMSLLAGVTVIIVTLLARVFGK